MTILVAALAGLLALALGYLVWRRVGPRRVSRRLTGYAALGGGIAAGVVVYLERLVLEFTGLEFDARVSGQAGALMATFLLAAPLEEAAKVLVVWPLYRAQRMDEPRVGAVYAAGAAAGFAAVEGAWLVLAAESAPLALVRATVSAVSQVFCAGAWGYALGAGRGARWFGVTWLVAVLLHGLFDHFVWGRGPAFLAATVPLMAFMALGASLALREPPRASVANLVVNPTLQSLQPPTLTEVQRALRPGDKPVMLRWVVMGAFVTLGLVITLVALSVVVAQRVGFDFALADEADVRSATPLLLLGASVLLAFPISGFLVARASASPTLLEPTLATLLALTALVGVLALMAPVGVLFALAVAPVALGLACAGAWVGLER